MGGGGGWYERIFVTVRLRLHCYLLSLVFLESSKSTLSIATIYVDTLSINKVIREGYNVKEKKGLEFSRPGSDPPSSEKLTLFSLLSFNVI